MMKLTKNNLSSFLTVYLLPILIASGMTVESSNLIIGIIVFVVMIGAQIYSERHPSSWFEVVDDNSNEEITENNTNKEMLEDDGA